MSYRPLYLHTCSHRGKVHTYWHKIPLNSRNIQNKHREMHNTHTHTHTHTGKYVPTHSLIILQRRPATHTTLKGLLSRALCCPAVGVCLDWQLGDGGQRSHRRDPALLLATDLNLTLLLSQSKPVKMFCCRVGMYKKSKMISSFWLMDECVKLVLTLWLVEIFNTAYCLINGFKLEIYARLDAVHVILCWGLTTDGRK